MTEFYEQRVAELGDPAQDRPLTLRVHPDDDPRDQGARRVIKNGDEDGCSWILVTGEGEGWDRYLLDEQVMFWPYTNHALASAAFRPADEHRTYEFDGAVVACACGASEAVWSRTVAGSWWQSHRQVTRATERGDMDVDAFKGGVS